MKPLASFGNSTIESHTNLSTSISLSILDQYGNEISIQTNLSNPIEILIPRDPNLIISSMILQNVISLNSNFIIKFSIYIMLISQVHLLCQFILKFIH